jgi:hypothetical protein
MGTLRFLSRECHPFPPFLRAHDLVVRIVASGPVAVVAGVIVVGIGAGLLIWEAIEGPIKAVEDTEKKLDPLKKKLEELEKELESGKKGCLTTK